MGQQQQVMGQQHQINMTHHQQNVEASTEHESTSPRLTYRQKRRLEQAELRLKFPDRKRHGPMTGKKYGPRMWNSNSEAKIKINFMDELRRVVGKKADEFICDFSNWVKEYCPLDSWVNMIYLNRLLVLIIRDLGSEQHFRNKSIADAINRRPNTIDHIIKVNTENKLKQTETPANGARSTARIFHDLINAPPTQPTQELDGEPDGSSDPHETQQNPHKGSVWEPNAEKDYEALKRLHEKEIEKHGEDTLSVKDAYMKVFKQKSGYVKIIGPGARPPKKCRAERESNEKRVSLSLEIKKLKDDAAVREASLASEIETLKASNVELKNSNEELKTSNEELIASTDELKTVVSRINVEALNVKRSSETI
ncbi:hypothetical protein RDABS01_008886 [Bienertia sinuspersici]